MKGKQTIRQVAVSVITALVVGLFSFVSRNVKSAVVTVFCATMFCLVFAVAAPWADSPWHSQSIWFDYTHPSSPSNAFEHVGSWGDKDFAITKFAGIEFGSSAYCRPNEQGVSMWGGPREADNLHVPLKVSRRSVVALEDKPLGFDRVQIEYTYESRRLTSLCFCSERDDTDNGYREVRKIFDDSIMFLEKEYKMPPPVLTTTSALGKLDGLLYSACSGSSSVFGNVRSISNGKVEVYLLIENMRYVSRAKTESDNAIANPPTKTIKDWVDGFLTNPRYFNKTEFKIEEREGSVLEKALQNEIEAENELRRKKEAESKRRSEKIEKQRIAEQEQRMAEREQLKAQLEKLRAELLKGKKAQPYTMMTVKNTKKTNVLLCRTNRVHSATITNGTSTLNSGEKVSQ